MEKRRPLDDKHETKENKNINEHNPKQKVTVKTNRKLENED